MELVCRNLTKRYLTKTAVDNFNLTLNDGHIYALLGPNGSGKSTLMKMIAGLTNPTGGYVDLNGENVGWKTKADIVYTPTEPFFFGYMTIGDVAEYYGDFFKDFDRRVFTELLREMELGESMKTRKLSSGMLAKVKIAVTMARRAKVILLDEPFNGIDLIARDYISKLLIRYAPEDGVVVISSHMVEEIEKMIDVAVFMKQGRLELVSDVEKLRAEENISLADKYRQLYSKEA